MRTVHSVTVGRARAAALWTGVALVSALLLGTTPCAADEIQRGGKLEVNGKVLESGDNLSAGGSYRVQGKQVLPTNGLGNPEFTLDPAGAKQAKSSGGCPCQGLFADGFESGDLGAWSASVGNSKNN